MSNSRVIPVVMENGANSYVPPAQRNPQPIAVLEPSGSYIHRLRPEQIEALEQEFSKVKTLHTTDLELLAAEMGSSEKDIQVSWKQGCESGDESLEDLIFGFGVPQLTQTLQLRILSKSAFLNSDS